MSMLKNAASSRAKIWAFRALVLVVLVKLAFFTFSSTTNDPKAVEAQKQKNVTEPPKPAPPPAEAALGPGVTQNNQPLRQPNTFIPMQHELEAQDLNLISPTADQIVLRLQNGNLEYAKRNDIWEVGVINSKPDVLMASEKHYGQLAGHYDREHRIYTLMKWILRVHRRDPNRKSPLLMIDAGSNHGLFAMVAAASGARVVAFEPQTNLRSSIGLNARLNQVANRIRVLPFAILNRYRKLSMSKYNLGDGGIGQLDFSSKDAIMNTQTIRLDDIPAFHLLFGDNENHKSLINNPKEIDASYAASIDACNAGTQETIDEALTLRQPIHFLKIDVEGFELRALESASKLFELGLIENMIMEFGPPNRWDSTVENTNVTESQKRLVTTIHARYLMHRAINEWNMDIYLLPAAGWGNTAKWMYQRNLDYGSGLPGRNKIVHKLMYWDFDGMAPEGDEFEMEINGKKQLITELIPLHDDQIDAYLTDLKDIGEMYVWFTKRDGNPNILEQLEI